MVDVEATAAGTLVGVNECVHTAYVLNLTIYLPVETHYVVA